MNLNPTGFAPAADLCPNDQQQGSILFSDNLESGSDLWSSEELTGTPNIWSLTSNYASSGTTSLWGSNPGFSVDAVNYNIEPVTLTPDSYLHFRHGYSFESWLGNFFYDGGVVEYSTEGSS